MFHRIFSNKLIPSFVTFAVLATLLLPSFTGCSGGGGNSRLEKLMGMIPASADEPHMLFTFSDYAARFKALGVSYDSFEELLDALDHAQPGSIYPPGILVEASFIAGGGRYMNQTTIREEYVGYDILDVDAEIQYGFPPSEAVVAIGSFDPEKTRNALNNQANWTDTAIKAYTEEDYNGVTIHSWGDGARPVLQARRSPPVYDELGRARPLAVTNDYLFSEARLEVVKEMIDAANNKTDNLMSLEKFASIVSVLAGLDVNRAVIGNSVYANRTNQAENSGQTAIHTEYNGALLKKYLSFGSAPAEDAKGTYVIVVLYHENPALAKENVTLLEQQLQNDVPGFPDTTWSDRISSYEIKANGNLVTAKLYTEHTGFYQPLTFISSGFLAHEE